MGEIDFLLDGLRHNLDELSMLHKGGTATKTKVEYHIDKHLTLTDNLKLATRKKYK